MGGLEHAEDLVARRVRGELALGQLEDGLPRVIQLQGAAVGRALIDVKREANNCKARAL
jgi:hypothetical protein